MNQIKGPKWIGSKIEIAIFLVGFLIWVGYAALALGFANNVIDFLNKYFPHVFFNPKDYHADTYLFFVYWVVAWITSLILLILGIWKKYSLSKKNEHLSRIGIIGCFMTGVVVVFPVLIFLTGLIASFGFR